jgi:hypothetical protein
MTQEIPPITSPQLIVRESTRVVVEPSAIEGENKVVEKTYISFDFYDRYGNIRSVNETRILDYLV